MKRFSPIIILTALLITGIVVLAIKILNEPEPALVSQPAKSTGAPALAIEVVASSLDHPWDVGFTSDNIMIFTERAGTLSAYIEGSVRSLTSIPDVVARGEGGLMGLAVHPDFANNRFIYTCFNTAEDIRLVRWRISNNYDGLTDRADIVTGMPVTSGRHSGCRPRFSPDGALWIGTGDVAVGTNPQDPKSLGGKILRVDRDGKAWPGNLEEPFDPRIYSYGHRNVQGLAFRADSSGYSAEHGPDKNDEINALAKGNFGWDPVPGYNENVPMTDNDKFPEAIPAVWSSGPIIAPSGVEILKGRQWKTWDGALVVAALRGQQLRILIFDQNNKLQSETITLQNLGRLRGAVQGPDGNLYITTDNGGGQDQILRIIPN